MKTEAGKVSVTSLKACSGIQIQVHLTLTLDAATLGQEESAKSGFKC